MITQEEISNLANFFTYEGNFDLIQCTDKVKFNTILDVGLGRGGASSYFALQNKEVTSLGINIDEYDVNPLVYTSKNINIIEVLFENFNINKKFDAILMSHILEHTSNVGLFLDKAYSLLNDDGWLFVMVPPYKKNVVGGHITNGWNMGQLMYNLLWSGFNIKNGHFISYGYNICAFVQKYNIKPEVLKSYHGSLQIVKDYWPINIYQGFNGNIEQVNWFNDFSPSKYYYPQTLKQEYEVVVKFCNFCLELDKTKKYILYGYGTIGKLIYSHLKDSIIGIIDNNLKDKDAIIIEDKKVEVLTLEKLRNSDNLIISPFLYNKEIISSLKNKRFKVYSIEI